MTKELKELVAFGLSVAELVGDVADGLSFSLVGKVVAVAREAGPGLEGAGEALSEYANMTDAEALDLETYINENFDISNDDVEAAIESALKLAIQLHGLVKLLLPKKG